MDQTNNQFSGFQSHYVPAEKPYAVYAYVWEGPLAAIAQLIGTMLVGKVNDKGKIEFDGKAVYRMPQKDMLDFDHCFVPEYMGRLYVDPIPLGFVGDTVGKDELVKVVEMVLKETDSDNVKSFIDDMQMAGLKVELGAECKMQDVEGLFDLEYNDNNKSNDYFLVVNKDIALRVKIWNTKSKSERAQHAVCQLWSQIASWQEVGVTFEHIKMETKNKDYQALVDELLELAKIYGKYEMLEEKSCRMYRLLNCREVLGTGRCFYEDFVMGMKKVYWDDYSGYDEDLQWAINVGLITREGNIIQFSTEVERIVAWQWVWKPEEDKD